MGPKKHKTISEKTDLAAQKRRAKREREDEALTQGWKLLEKEDSNFSLKRAFNREQCVLNIRRPKTLLQIFNSFLTLALMKKMWEAIPIERLTYSLEHQRTVNEGKFDEVMLKRILAVHIRIQGNQSSPTESDPTHRPLRNAFKVELHYFLDKHGLHDIHQLGINILETVTTHFLILDVHTEELSRNFQEALRTLGDVVSGDEKLFHFTGNSGHVRLVPSKPDRIGLWIYELVAVLENNKPFLLHLKFHNSNKADGESIPVASVIEAWGQATKRLNPNTVLVADSYYFSAASRRICIDNDYKFIVAVPPVRFSAICDILSPTVTKRGDWRAAFNQVTNELMVHHWSMETTVGKKFVLSNAFEKKGGKIKAGRIPVFDEYKAGFSACDMFNRALHDRTWPFKRGGRQTFGDLGTFHDFAFSAIIQNTFNAYLSIDGETDQIYNYRSYCVKLADELFESTINK